MSRIREVPRSPGPEQRLEPPHGRQALGRGRGRSIARPESTLRRQCCRRPSPSPPLAGRNPLAAPSEVPASPEGLAWPLVERRDPAVDCDRKKRVAQNKTCLRSGLRHSRPRFLSNEMRKNCHDSTQKFGSHEVRQSLHSRVFLPCFFFPAEGAALFERVGAATARCRYLRQEQPSAGNGGTECRKGSEMTSARQHRCSADAA